MKRVLPDDLWLQIFKLGIDNRIYIGPNWHLFSCNNMPPFLSDNAGSWFVGCTCCSEFPLRCFIWPARFKSPFQDWSPILNWIPVSFLFLIPWILYREDRFSVLTVSSLNQKNNECERKQTYLIIIKRKNNNAIVQIHLYIYPSNWGDQKWSPYQMMFGTRCCKSVFNCKQPLWSVDAGSCFVGHPPHSSLFFKFLQKPSIGESISKFFHSHCKFIVDRKNESELS